MCFISMLMCSGQQALSVEICYLTPIVVVLAVKWATQEHPSDPWICHGNGNVTLAPGYSKFVEVFADASSKAQYLILLCLCLGGQQAKSSVPPYTPFISARGPYDPQITASFTLINLFPISRTGVLHDQQLVLSLGYNFIVHPVKTCCCFFIKLSGT
jgi:hypothetical protein